MGVHFKYTCSNPANKLCLLWCFKSNKLLLDRPLYFQHDGHSRTIVGIQVKYQQSGIPQYSLLVMDPGHVIYLHANVYFLVI